MLERGLQYLCNAYAIRHSGRSLEDLGTNLGPKSTFSESLAQLCTATASNYARAQVIDKGEDKDLPTVILAAHPSPGSIIYLTVSPFSPIALHSLQVLHVSRILLVWRILCARQYLAKAEGHVVKNM